MYASINSLCFYAGLRKLHCYLCLFEFPVVVNHSINLANETTNDTGLFDDLTVTLTTTESVTTTETTTKNVTIYHTVTPVVPSPSSLQNSGAASSTSCSSSDNDNTPIYVAVAIVIVGLLITIVAIIVGVLFCRHRYWKEKQFDGSRSPIAVTYKTANSADFTMVVEVDNDLYGKEALQPQSR